MACVKKRLLSESVNFIEVCQLKVLSGKINIATYNLLSDMKIDFLRDFLKAEMYDVYIDRDFSSRIKRLFTVNCLIKCRELLDVRTELQ